MQVDNSGTTVVFDKKTAQAIEEGKNRITMLQVEELRLKNLKKELEQQIISLEADIDYKKSVDKKLVDGIEELRKEFHVFQDKVKDSVAEQKFISETLDIREYNIQAQETAVHEKELALNAQQSRLNDLVERTEKDWVIAEKAKDDAYERMKKIDDFLKSL